MSKTAELRECVEPAVEPRFSVAEPRLWPLTLRLSESEGLTPRFEPPELRWRLEPRLEEHVGEPRLVAAEPRLVEPPVRGGEEPAVRAAYEEETSKKLQPDDRQYVTA